MNIPLTESDTWSDLTRILESKGLKICDDPMPVGMKETRSWLSRMTDLSVNLKAQNYLDRNSEWYKMALDRALPISSGKKAYIAIRFGSAADWIVSTLTDLEMDIVKVVRIGQNGRSPLKNRSLAPFSSGMSMVEFLRDVKSCRPDIVLCDFRTIPETDTLCGMIPGGNIGPDASIALAEYISNILRLPRSVIL